MLADDSRPTAQAVISRKDTPGGHSRADAPADCARDALASTLPSLVAAQGVDVTTVAWSPRPAAPISAGTSKPRTDSKPSPRSSNIRAEVQENAGYEDITPTLKDLRTTARS